MAQLQHMDAYIDTISTELYHVNVCVGRIAWQQATKGGYAPEASPPPPSQVDFDSEDKDDDDGDDNAGLDDDDGDASSSGTDKMFTWYSYPLSLVTKRGSSFGFESSHT